MDTAEETLASRDVAIQGSRDLVKLVTNLELLFAMGLEVFEDSRVDQAGGTVARHLVGIGENGCKVQVVDAGSFRWHQQIDDGEEYKH